MDKRRDINDLMQRLGYIFKDVDLLELALTHRSFNYKNNERLEFLGDAILSYIVADSLFIRYKSVQEGQLTRMRSNLVKGETLAQLAQEFSLGEYLLLGQGELKSGGFKRKSILSDALEAIIGAIYLDSDIETCKSIVGKWFTPLVESALSDAEEKDPKTKLQEWLQANSMDLPVYEVTSITGTPHNQHFKVTCTVGGHLTKGEGKSRRIAEQIAAENLLNILNAKN